VEREIDGDFRLSTPEIPRKEGDFFTAEKHGRLSTSATADPASPENEGTLSPALGHFKHNNLLSFG